ncbi:MAG: molybdenum cofactor biosynthesis protein B [Planctomycetota bacterium]
MNDPVQQHRQTAPAVVRCAVATISDTRTLDTDTGGRTAIDLLSGAGHVISARELIPDDSGRIQQLLLDWSKRDDIDAILMTGGTGLSSRDQTYETVSGLLTKTLPGYGELFRWLSYQEIGAAAMLSRAIGGLIHKTVVMTMPGSPHAVRLALNQLIIPELGHLVREANR